MLTTGIRTTTVWRLGVPAVLMVAFGLVGLAQAPWRGDQTHRPVPAVTPARLDATPAPGTDDRVRRAASTTTEDAEAREAPPAPERVATRERPAPSVRLPEELEPATPDVVVAMEPAWPATGLSPVVMHSHLDSAPDGGPASTPPDGAMGPAGDDIQGPEPGARFWFGPGGLERVRVLGEAQP